MSLLYIAAAALLAGAIITVAVSMLTKDKARSLIRDKLNEPIGAVIKKMRQEGGITRISMSALSSDNEMEIEAESTDGSFRVGETIYT